MGKGPQGHPKFTQITTNVCTDLDDNQIENLYALDAEGGVWSRDWDEGAWVRLTDKDDG